MPVIANYSLQAHNTMALPCRASGFITLRDDHDLDVLLEALHGQWRAQPLLILGGGSNVLLLEDFPGLVVHPGQRDIQLLADHDNEVLLRVGAGRNWHDLVEWSVARGYHGLQNMALIPGLCGAAPIQNIGAYGVEFSHCCVQVELCDLASGNHFTLPRDDCEFHYRHSIFKTPRARNWLVTAITLRLQHHAEPKLDYPGLREALQQQDLGDRSTTDSTSAHSPAAIAAAVCRLRRSKLPDPAQLGNCGSFFKNPVVDAQQLHSLLAKAPQMPHWPVADSGAPGHSKLSAGWLIEQCGWKGHRRGAAGVHSRHALVLVNHGGASGSDIWQLARDIRDSVAERFGLVLEPEPVIIPTQN